MHTRAERRHYHEARVRRLYRRWKMFNQEAEGKAVWWLQHFGETPKWAYFNYHKHEKHGSLRFPFHGTPTKIWKVGWRREVRAKLRQQAQRLADLDDFQFFKHNKLSSIWDWT